MKRLLAVLAAGALILSLAPVASAQAPGVGMVTVVHAIPDVKADIYVNGVLKLADVRPKSTSTQMAFVPGVYTVDVRAAGAKKSASPLLSGSFTVADQSDQSVLLGYTEAGKLTVQALANSLACSTGMARFQFAHMAAYGAMDVWINGGAAAFAGVMNEQKAPNPIFDSFDVAEGAAVVWTSPEKIPPKPLKVVIGPYIMKLTKDTLYTLTAFGPKSNDKMSFVMASRQTTICGP